ncbi:type IIL restriction-modification enzyme MmeI [Roseiconus lacunae]|uniref:type IIL restriction-modification enzyme MmeI n=1 Tax=Roseiconus lacunae TaxID=2605694 RepID=UPI001E430B1E|nr:type IIL restriction-modification enzyme MmeI [Roseiconus lacunae]MCD0458646.1 hypothetical protein [Roseiconus lacunae]
MTSKIELDGKPVEQITAFLVHRGSHNTPNCLAENEGKCFIGSYVLGMGFTFDDTDSSGLASSVEEMHKLIKRNPANQQRIFPYMGGEDLLKDPQQAVSRYVINFADFSLDEARDWPDLLNIVEQRVRPAREKLRDNADGRRRKHRWWQWGRYTGSLFQALAPLERTIVCARIGKAFAFSVLPSDIVYSEKTVVFPSESTSFFASLQSRPHEVWTRFFSSTLGDTLQYTPSICFETFPFPHCAENAQLEAIGNEYIETRYSLMCANAEGITDTYNRFHSSDERDEGILELRRLHGLMDGAVLRAYGWDDLAEQAAKPDFCQFLLDYEEEEDDEPGSKKSKKKKPWRYRWPDDFRDEVLARLLGLNEQRHKEEQLTGMSEPVNKQSKTAKASNTQSELF